MTSEQIVAAILAPGVLGIIFFPYLQMARGKLVSRSALDDERADTEVWREAHRVSEAARAIDSQARATMAHQVSELLEHARTTDTFIRALAHAGEVHP